MSQQYCDKKYRNNFNTGDKGMDSLAQLRSSRHVPAEVWDATHALTGYSVHVAWTGSDSFTSVWYACRFTQKELHDVLGFEVVLLL